MNNYSTVHTTRENETQTQWPIIGRYTSLQHYYGKQPRSTSKNHILLHLYNCNTHGLNSMMPSHIRCIISDIYPHYKKRQTDILPCLAHFIPEKKAVSQTIALGSLQQMEAPPIITSGSSSSSLPSMTKHVRMTKASK
mmetsp:Transcript_26606/g.41299  ORF Transcript_26606/g.41299 Transcript_26606/m.41299 type:complete len:138 (+) Transcript_26606:27-440(+)